MVAQINKNKTKISSINSRANFPISFLNLIFKQSINNFINYIRHERRKKAMCNCPITAYKYGKTENGKTNIVFKNPYEVTPPGMEIKLPCGRCMACRIEKTRQWGMRAEHEAKFYDENCFITLTYAPENLPPSLEKRPLQLFMKSLRKFLKGQKIKYIASGELGENYDNPHYHICLFGWLPKDLQFLYTKKGANYYTSKVLENIWKNGFIIVTELNFATARYTAKYSIKKELGSKEKTRPAEFFVCSKGIGLDHVNKYGDDMAKKGQTFANNNSCSLPRYYKEKIKNTSNNLTLQKTLDKQKKICKDKNKKIPLTKQSYQKHANEVILKSKY